jgi:hypothetical protein
MPNHYIQYIPRRVVKTRPTKVPTPSEVASAAQALGFHRPKYHLTKSKTGLVTRVQSGDTIWLIGQLHSPWGKLPPSVDARIDVAECRAHERGYTFVAAEASRWFPLADASHLLTSLLTRRQDNSTYPLLPDRNLPIGIVMQQLRRLADAQPLITWVEGVEAQGYDFVSYRLKDGTRQAFDCVKCLLANCKTVFWDRWSLPRQLAEQHLPVEDAFLRNHLEQAIQQANITWGIQSHYYGAAESFSAYEREIATRLGNFSLLA